MKTSRLFRIFMMALDTFVLFILRLFRKFTRLETFPKRDLFSLDTPYPTRHTRPEVLGIQTELEVDGKPVEQYQRKDPIYFDPDKPYTDHKGIVTFRGDNWRQGAAYGKVELREKKLEVVWQRDTGKLQKGYGTGYWTGSGWTGQPLLVEWDKKARRTCNFYPEKRDKEGLVEAIYSTMDGNIYFLDVEDGQDTRDVIHIGLPFKGAGALDPRKEAPVVYVGAGDSGPNPGEYARLLAYSLVDGEKLLELGGEDPFAQRVFHGYDSSPLVDAQADTLIEPGENGIFYTLKLNTSRDPETGAVRFQPGELVKLRYRSKRSSSERYWLGMEDSAVIWKNYLYAADNGGNLFCLDLNTMEMIWVQDVEDDTNGSPVFSIEEGIPYIYIATSLHWTASRLLKLGDVPIFKINALNGEYVWRRRYLCNTVAGISGGIQATCVLGKGDIEDLVIFPVARTPEVRGGILVALDKKTGEEVWKVKLRRYAWSSPVALYDQEDKAYLVQCDAAGNVYLIEGATGQVLDAVNLGSNVEASPAVFGDRLVVGTRGQKIFGIRIK